MPTEIAPAEVFVVVPPGLEPVAAAEAGAAGFVVTGTDPGGLRLAGGLDEAMRANLTLRGAVRVLVRIADFRAMHLAQLDKRARKVDWAGWLRPEAPFRVEATCRKSRIYHDRAAAQRIERAIAEVIGAKPDKDAAIVVKARIFDDLCTISLDTTGEALHRRGFKQAVNAAPMRETMAALLLRGAGFDGLGPVFDPMCGSGTFVLEAAELAAGLLPGRARGFAFEGFSHFDAAALAALRGPAVRLPATGNPLFFGADRDAGAVEMSTENAARAGVAATTRFHRATISEAVPPCDATGLVITNPPYGARIGDRKALFGLYGAFGARMKEAFSGWRVAFVTTDEGLAKATNLDFSDISGPIAHGGMKLRLYQTAALR